MLAQKITLHVYEVSFNILYYCLFFMILPGERELVLSICKFMLSPRVHAPGLFKSCHILSSSSFPKSATSHSPLLFSPSILSSLFYFIIHSQGCRGRADCCAVTSTVLTFQQRRFSWQFYTPLSPPLSLPDVTRSVPLHLTALIFSHLSISFSPSRSLSKPCLTFPALIGRGEVSI